MSADDARYFLDLRFLFEASKNLHGYLIHTWFTHYLDVIVANVRRLLDRGAVGPEGQPTEQTDFRMMFDFDALDIEKVTYLVGFYMYVMASHKKANFFLMREEPTRRVLYLRGFDYEGATATGGGMAVGYSSTHTTRFNRILAEQLRPEFEIFTALSPRDLFWETSGAQRYFHGDYDGLIRASSNPIRSVHLNANHWREDVAWLLDRMDHFVVYVSSITESVLWELELLRDSGRAADVTVVFDEDAIDNKEMQEGLQEAMGRRHVGDVLWSKGRPDDERPTPAELRDRLARSFVVVSPDGFVDGIEAHRSRIREASSPLAVGSREDPLPFRFFPALDPEPLERIRDFDGAVDAEIAARIAERSITNLPWFLNLVQLRIYTSLMLGRHDQTGRALAVYGAVVETVRRRLMAEASDGLSAEQRAAALSRAEEHAGMAAYAAPRLMALGETHQFGDYSAQARTTYDELFAAAAEAVESFFAEAGRRAGG